jgi:hypothetical protein
VDLKREVDGEERSAMEKAISDLVTQFESGALSRRQLIRRDGVALRCRTAGRRW